MGFPKVGNLAPAFTLLDQNGKKFYQQVFESQKKRIFNALKHSDSDSVIKFKEVLKKIINGKK